MSHYEEDEFDVAARERGPVGVHRRLEPAWQRYLPYLVVIILAPLLAWAAVSFFGSSQAPAPAPPTAASSEQTPDEAEPSEEPSEEATTESPSPEASTEATDKDKATEQPETEAPAAADLSQQVTVLNGAGVNGLGARVTKALKADGFTNVVAENYKAATPKANTIYYNSPAHKAAAERVGAKLGITNLVESSRSSQSIAVVLRTNVLGR